MGHYVSSFFITLLFSFIVYAIAGIVIGFNEPVHNLLIVVIVFLAYLITLGHNILDTIKGKAKTNAPDKNQQRNQEQSS